MKFVTCRSVEMRDCRGPLEQSYLRDLSTLRLYCGAECYPTRIETFHLSTNAETNPFELIFEWQGSTSDIVLTLFGWGDHQHAASSERTSFERCI